MVTQFIVASPRSIFMIIKVSGQPSKVPIRVAVTYLWNHVLAAESRGGELTSAPHLAALEPPL